MREIVRLIIIVCLILFMTKSYSDYIDIINEVENVEHVVITDNKTKKCCYYTIELS